MFGFWLRLAFLSRTLDVLVTFVNTSDLRRITKIAGIEPTQMVLKTIVLPLNYISVIIWFICKVNYLNEMDSTHGTFTHFGYISKNCYTKIKTHLTNKLRVNTDSYKILVLIYILSFYGFRSPLLSEFQLIWVYVDSKMFLFTTLNIY